MTGYADRADALAFLAFSRPLAGQATLDDFDQNQISFVPAATPGGNTARVSIDFVLGGERSSQVLGLRQSDGAWRILWEQK